MAAAVRHDGVPRGKNEANVQQEVLLWEVGAQCGIFWLLLAVSTRSGWIVGPTSPSTAEWRDWRLVADLAWGGIRIPAHGGLPGGNMAVV